MKRPLFIIFGTIVILILLVVWFYVLFFSDGRTPSDSFTELSFGDTDTELPTQITPPTEPVIDISTPKKLRQLTTKPTIGYQEVRSHASTTPEVWHVESGTGHVYSINLLTGEEKRVSGTTIPLALTAAITPNGQHAMFQSGTGNSREFIIGTFNSDSDTLMTGLLAESITDFTTTNDNTFLYAVQTANSVVGKEYNPETDRTNTLFTLPFREATIDWGSVASGPHYAYPKASSKLEGFLYQIKDGVLTRLPIDGFGLTAAGSPSHILFSKQVEDVYTTYARNLLSNETSLFSMVIVPDKCTSLPTNSSKFICGGNLTNSYTDKTPDTWYQGITTYSDGIWEVDTTHSFSVLLFDVRNEIGRDLDTTEYLMNSTGERVYFINKSDRTLWLFTYLMDEANTL